MTEMIWFPTALLFGGLVVGLVLGIPIAFAIGAIAIIVSYLYIGPESLSNIVFIAYGVMRNAVIIAALLFVFMACILEKSGVADKLYDAMHHWMGGIHGGLAMATTVICTVIAAMSGITATGVVTMGLIALPIMLKKGYDKSIAIGPIVSGGALGILIPPSLSCIIYGALTKTSIGRLFAGGVIPGLVLVALYILYIGIRCFFQPHLAPTLPPEERGSFKQKVVLSKGIILPVLLIFGVLGSIFFGIASPTEASSVGAAGAIICAAVYRRLNWTLIKDTMYRSMGIIGMVMWILFAAFAFAGVFVATGGSQLTKEFILGLGLKPFHVVLVMTLSYFVLGCFINELTIMVITVPIYLPILLQLGYDPVWFGILFIVNMQMAYLTPPFGFCMFYLKGVTPPEITMGDIYRAVFPFVGLQAIGVLLVMFFPQLVLWLPELVFGLK